MADAGGLLLDLAGRAAVRAADDRDRGLLGESDRLRELDAFLHNAGGALQRVGQHRRAERALHHFAARVARYVMVVRISSAFGVWTFETGAHA